ncbi:NAC domain containing protein 25 [Euphorbia peplus]|nr:NAC domain containing protein 25 [Euphorbia peplus]
MEDSNNHETLPMGFRFLPTDEEVVLHYLNLKLNGGSLPPMIDEFNLYADKNPCEILEIIYTGIFHVEKTTDVNCGHSLMTDFSPPGRVGNYVVCKIYNKEVTTTKPMRSKKRKLPTNTNSAYVGSFK